MKTCKICGAVFSPRDYSQSICSDECRKVSAKKASKKNYSKTHKQNYCVLCGAETKGFVCMGTECRKTYHKVYSWTQNRMKLNIRASGKKYTNSLEKLNAIKNKYKNGVTVEQINKMLGVEK